VEAPFFLHVGGSSCCLVAAMSCADFCGRIDCAKRQSVTSVSEVTAEEGREKFLCTQLESNRQPLAYETRMVPQDHCQCTARMGALCATRRFLPTASLVCDHCPNSDLGSVFLAEWDSELTLLYSMSKCLLHDGQLELSVASTFHKRRITQ
jgi:hypothetical protein